MIATASTLRNVRAPNFEAQVYDRIALVACPTGAYCREDRCQSFFNFELIPSMRAPLEECEISGALKVLGVKHWVIDAPAEHYSDLEFIRRLKDINPDLILLAVTFGSLKEDLEWAKKIKELLPIATIGLRGAPCYVWDKKFLAENSAVDFCVRGDYELVFDAILKGGLSNAAGVTYRSEDGAIESTPLLLSSNLDELPFADRSVINPKLYKVRAIGRAQATIRVQRGCPYPCSYCLVHTVSGNKARHRSPQNIVSEMRQLVDQGITHFYLRAETFSLDKDWASAVSQEIGRICPTARWVTTTRVECVDEDVLSDMSRGGCYGISFGVDIASEKIGKLVRKPPRLKQACEAMRLCDRYGIISLGYFMIGFVWDTEETLAETEKFIYEARPDLITIHFAHPYPGTAYYEAVNNLGSKVVSLKAQAEPAIALETLSPKDLSRAAKKMLIRHYSRPAVLYSLGRKGIRLIAGKFKYF